MIPTDPKQKLIYAVTGGLLLFLGWPPIPFPILLFIGFVPLLLIAEAILNDGDPMPKWRLFKWSFLMFFIWNAATTWWVMLATVPGGIMAVLGNSILMSLPVLFYFIARKNMGRNGSFIALLVYWMGFEYFHLHWEASWPWLNLGNGFAVWHWMVQWYEITGVFGGTAWTLVVNYLVFAQILKFSSYQKIADHLNPDSSDNKNKALLLASLKPLMVLVLPILASLIWYYSASPPIASSGMNVVIVQPNINPYTENFYNEAEQLKNVQDMIALSEKKLGEQTDLLIWPETAFETLVWKSRPDQEKAFRMIRSFVNGYDGLSLVTGLVLAESYKTTKPPTITAKQVSADFYYDIYNAAVLISSGVDSVQWYHKSKLVPGAEGVPYYRFLKFAESFAENIAGQGLGNYGTKDEYDLFRGKINAIPAICYESIYGDFLRKHVKLGAEYILVITNDGWWGNTAGRKQHFLYAKLRAIETRKYVARSANTGISGVIDPMGDVVIRAKRGVEDTLEAEIFPVHKKTFYTKYGDILGRLSAYGSIMLIFISIVRVRIKRTSKVTG